MGLYPNEQVIGVFGEQVKWPGLGPDGKFTNGSFTDPLVKPSFIPAETLNLLLDNMQRVIEGAGLDPNNIERDQLVRAVKALNKKTATFVVGSIGAGHTLADCDYLCDGVDDQVEINAAIQALPAGGGEVVIREGTYNITGRVNVNKANVTITGMGAATILKRMYDETDDGGIIHITGNNVKVTHLFVNGNKTTYRNVVNHGIYSSGSYSIIITNNTFNNNGYGIMLAGSNSIASGNISNNNNVHGIISTGSNSTITGNISNNNWYGITLAGSNSIASGNISNNNRYGIFLNGGSNSTITGNNCNNNDDDGIIVNGGSNNTITGNSFLRGTGLTTDYSAAQYTIRVEGGANNLFVGNNILGKNYVNNGGATHAFANNKYS